MKNKRLHGQTYLPWRLSSGYDPNPPVALQALLESSAENRHTNEQHCSLQLRQRCAHSRCFVLSRLRPMTSCIVNDDCLGHLAVLLNKSRKKVLSAQPVCWFLIHSVTFRAVWGEKLQLKNLIYMYGKPTVTFQVHLPLCGLFFWLMFGGGFLFVCFFLLVFFLVGSNGSHKWKPKSSWANLYSPSFLSWLLYQDSWKYFLFALVVAPGGHAFVTEMHGIAAAPHFRTRKQADCEEDLWCFRNI